MEWDTYERSTTVQAVEITEDNILDVMKDLQRRFITAYITSTTTSVYLVSNGQSFSLGQVISEDGYPVEADYQRLDKSVAADPIRKIKEGDRVRRVGPHVLDQNPIDYGDSECEVGWEGTVLVDYSTISEYADARVRWDRSGITSSIARSSLEIIDG